MSQYFPKPYEAFSGDINVKVNLSNYATKADIKSISHIDTSSFALKANLANLKTEVDKLDIDKLKPLPDGVSKLSNVVANEDVKKTDYNSKITEIENKIPDISNLVTRIPLTTVENKIPDTSSLVKKADYNTKITEIEGKIPDISNLATKTALTNLSNTVPDTLIKKSDYDTKIREIEKKYVSNTGFDLKLAKANVIKKNLMQKLLSLKNYKHLIQAILEVKAILKKVVHKII